ncbi:MAG: hypothetical protein WBY53_03220, partial [Acidobacteriaceae bacterium]
MTFVGEWQYDSVGYDHRPLPRFAFPQRAIGGAALAAFALACAWTIYADTMGTTDITATAPRGDRLVSARDAAQADAARRG